MKLIIVSLVCLVSLFGQGGYTVYQKLVTDGSVNDAPFGPVNNIGQSSHQFTMIWKDAPGQTCDQYRNSLVPGNDAYLDVINTSAPADLNTISRMPLFVTNASGDAPTAAKRFTRTYIGTGVSPFTYVYFRGVNFTKCRVDVYYSGSLNSYFNTPTFSTALSGFTDSLKVVSGSVATGNNVFPIGGIGSNGFRVSLYGISISNQGAASTGDLYIQEQFPNAATAILQTYRFAANSNITVFPGSIPIAITELSSGFGLTNNTGQTITYTFWYRLE